MRRNEARRKLRVIAPLPKNWANRIAVFGERGARREMRRFAIIHGAREKRKKNGVIISGGLSVLFTANRISGRLKKMLTSAVFCFAFVRVALWYEYIGPRRDVEECGVGEVTLLGGVVNSIEIYKSRRGIILDFVCAKSR